MEDTNQAMQPVEDVEDVGNMENVVEKDVGPGAEVADPARQRLIAQFAARMGQSYGYPYGVSQNSWAIMWLCSIDLLASDVELAGGNNRQLHVALTSNTAIRDDILKPCTILPISHARFCFEY